MYGDEKVELEDIIDAIEPMDSVSLKQLCTHCTKLNQLNNVKEYYENQCTQLSEVFFLIIKEVDKKGYISKEELEEIVIFKDNGGVLSE